MTQLEQIQLPIKSDLERFGQLFNETLRHDNPLLNSVFQHIRQRKGKLMRPTLLLLVAHEFGEPTNASYLSAVMLELLHTASLVHDDVVDESDERRGQPSVNASYGNKLAVLAGDFLLSTSLKQTAETGDLRIVNHIAELGKKLSLGEIVQLSQTGADFLSEENYFKIIRLKTAALFASTAELGALSAGADDEATKAMNRLGECLGVCFQIRDDIFDYFDDKSVGKPTGSDMLEGKLTLPVLYALNTTENEAMKAIAARVKNGKATVEEIHRLIDFAKTEGGIAYAERKMEEYIAQALEQVAKFQNPVVRAALQAYVVYVANRSV